MGRERAAARRLRFGCALSALVVVVLGASASARAWRRTTVDGDPSRPLVWRSSTISMRLAAHTVRDLDPEQARQAVRAAMATWEGPCCSDLRLRLAGDSTSRETSVTGAFDDENTIFVRDDVAGDPWPPAPIVSPGALAVTTVIYRTSSGEILEVDLDVNAVTHTLSLDAAPSGSVATDLQGVLTHELGHVIGLAHSDVTDAVMIAGVPAGELWRRELEEDDVAGVCEVHPAPAGACDASPDGGLDTGRRHVTGCDCKAAPGASDRANVLAWLAAVLVATFAARRRGTTD
ncbi:MAG: matrixin family metalloprotease [Deltaproteobacteria bacterium]|nr:matrixin family metalloprotease [Deltaproteobacteria bacterium]